MDIIPTSENVFSFKHSGQARLLQSEVKQP